MMDGGEILGANGQSRWPSAMRVPGVDLAKLWAMFFVLTLHVVTNIQLGDQCSGVTVFVKKALEGISLMCIDLFVLSTGFLCVFSKWRVSRIINLWLSVVFWGVAVLLFCQFALGYSIGSGDYWRAAIPVLCNQYWFFTQYFMLFFVMPVLNRALLNMRQRECILIFAAVVIFICLYSILPRMPGIRVDAFGMRGGQTFSWFCIVYCVGAYIRLFSFKRLNPFLCFSTATALAVSPYCIKAILWHLSGNDGRLMSLASYVSPFTFGASIFFFFGCLNVTLSKKLIRIFSWLSPAVFGVYLIHVQPFVWKNI